MNIWAPLPNDTNTLYVEKLDDPGVGMPILWSPDPGVRCKVYCGSYSITTPAFGAVRWPRLRLLYGSDVVGSYPIGSSIGNSKTYRVTFGKFFRFTAGVSEQEYNIYWDSSIYLIHGFTLELGVMAIDAGDVCFGGVLYIDCWNDMSVKVGDK